jgi:hypothetical protein
VLVAFEALLAERNVSRAAFEETDLRAVVGHRMAKRFATAP